MPSRIMNAMGIDAGDDVKVVQKTTYKKVNILRLDHFKRLLLN